MKAHSKCVVCGYNEVKGDATMYLDERSNALLKEVINNPYISSARIEEKFHLTRRQVSYSLKKINSWLEENHLPPIKRTNSGKFIVSSILIDLYAGRPDKAQSTYIPSERERANLILLMVLSSESELSLVHFTSALDVSKNTILRDLKYIQSILSAYQLEIVYSRSNGYDIGGDEWNIRRLLVDLIQSILNMFNGRTFIHKLIDLPEIEIIKLRKQMEEIEERLHLTFIDERMELLPYVIAILLRRIKKGKVIKNLYHIDYEELSDTKEYVAAEILIRDIKNIPKEERLFITLQLLASKIFSSEHLTDKKMSEMAESIKMCLNLFEKKACVTLKEKEDLIKRIILHMKSAYYRIKYNLTTDYALIDRVSDQYKAVEFILKESIKPLEDYIGCEIPESELMFLTIILGGHLLSSGETINMKKKAVVVCPNGVSISELMDQTLRDLFPEFHFYQPLSIREFQRSQLEFDIVFSPVPLQTDKRLFIVERFITDYEKMLLRHRVMKEIFGFHSSMISAEHIANIVEKYAKVEDKTALVRALEDYIVTGVPQKTDEKAKASYQLSDFLTPEHIMIRDHVKDLQEAIDIASEPLVREGAITKNYVESMKRQFKELSPYVVLRNRIAIPHAAPEDGVNRVGMSLLVIKEGLVFEEIHKVHLIVVIAAVDKKTHIHALMQLMKLSDSEQDVQKIIQAEHRDKIVEMIAAYSRTGLE
jgi:transcriptional antiterminator/mannitol/fructose-specific phosphotransferase system IIA component (Ntr-type)